MLNRKREVNFDRWLLEDELILDEIMQKTKEHPEFMPETTREHMSEIIDGHYERIIHKIQLKQELKKLDLDKYFYISNQDGIDTKRLAGVLELDVNINPKLIKLMEGEVQHYFDTKGIIVKVNYDKFQFYLDFTTIAEEDESEIGKKVKLKMEYILENMITYDSEFIEAVNAVLIYKELQAETEKCCRCNKILSIDEDHTICKACEDEVINEVRKEDAEYEQKILKEKIDKGCPQCKRELIMLPDPDPEAISGYRWYLECKSCGWTEYLNEN